MDSEERERLLSIEKAIHRSNENLQELSKTMKDIYGLINFISWIGMLCAIPFVILLVYLYAKSRGIV